ncbi:TNF receptor-associated factor 4-like isoform X2 [Octopus vulgaris]|uniref:TNF receptor-associated factor 4-like isoform X2 n=1 Tax=Octopus vulgaris TaxID=6645 RepID=A0AA36BVE4_OCTVU|nr:TNF receptor-associated factor 4-like isoform X2 [Octopus vulgaris]
MGGRDVDAWLWSASAVRRENRTTNIKNSPSKIAGVFKCPEDDKPLDYSKLYPDNNLYTEITTSLIRCKHYKDGCKWVDQLGKLQNHNGNCPYESVWCENKCGARLDRRHLSNHMKNECHKRTVLCQYCKREFVEETLQTHQYKCPRFPVQCPNQCETAKIPREEVEVHIQERCPSVSITCAFKEAGCKTKCQRFHLDSHMEENMKRHLSLVWELVRQQQQEIRQLKNALHASTQITNGSYIWKISDYKTKYLEAAYKGAKELTCQPFYTSRNGYKVSASVFLNGYGNSDGKYLSLYFKILPGEYDNILEWPFRLPVTFTLYDQAADPDKRKNIVERFVPDPTRKQFKKPHPDIETLGFGYPKFLTLETLKTRNFIKDDALYIGISVDNKTFIVP